LCRIDSKNKSTPFLLRNMQHPLNVRGEKEMNRKIHLLFVTMLILALLAACNGAAEAPTPTPAPVDPAAPVGEETPAGPGTLTVMTHSSFAVTEDADVFYGVDNTFLSRALEERSLSHTNRRCWLNSR
jgi:ABC-type thiamine transport system substrate-binding protein